MIPSYISAYKSGRLKSLADEAFSLLENCSLCPRACGANRIKNKTGICKTGTKASVSSYGPHFGEETPLVGRYGSGTIFFTNCSLGCNFCQNYEISHIGCGTEINSSRLADIMLELQKRGCANINLVTPTHVVPQILSALLIAVEAGLSVPLVYNTSGYDKVATLKLLEDIIDIYMPDLKFRDPELARKTCKAPGYPAIARAAIKEMHRQVGDLIINGQGLAEKGLLLRHLLLPGRLEDARSIFHFIVAEISSNTYVNIMPQYQPYGDLSNTPELISRISGAEFKQAVSFARDEGLTRFG